MKSINRALKKTSSFNSSFKKLKFHNVFTRNSYPALKSGITTNYTVLLMKKGTKKI